MTPPHRSIPVSLILMLILTGCSVRPSAESIETFHAFTAQWQGFFLRGLMEVNQDEWQIRKDCVIRGDDHRIRLDILEGGLMGLRPTPWLTAVYDSTLHLRLPPELEDKPVDWTTLSDLIGKTIHELMPRLSALQEITENPFTMAGFEIHLDDQGRITSIRRPEAGRLIFTFGSTLQPREILFEKEDQVIVRIRVDRFEARDTEVPGI